MCKHAKPLEESKCTNLVTSTHALVRSNILLLEYFEVHLLATLILTVAAKWQEWGLWGPCSSTCGGGVQRRQRGYTEGRHGARAKPPGEQSEEKECGSDACGGNYTLFLNSTKQYFQFQQLGHGASGDPVTPNATTLTATVGQGYVKTPAKRANQSTKPSTVLTLQGALNNGTPPALA